ncbi:hypothetical protein HPP92_020457 [Vanilla planifolia]|uniref:HNH domain-containing protein n=1 Tax=Vanilla planifolia TaxID=51239 RepID=A0A835Q8H6_VANPL|nr:hypothetical protein HPP92_020457 [Vanilla planifolia]
MVGRQASVPSSTRAQSTAEQEGEGRPRFFDSKAKARCWQNADVVPGRHPERWRRDPVGNVVCKRFANCYGCLCFEYDHIIPYSKGGESITENCQILQTRVNRLKSDKEWVDRKELQCFSCDIKFTDKEMDVIEMAVYGDVIRPGHECRCRTVAEMLGQASQLVALPLPIMPDLKGLISLNRSFTEDMKELSAQMSCICHKGDAIVWFVLN